MRLARWPLGAKVGLTLVALALGVVFYRLLAIGPDHPWSTPVRIIRMGAVGFFLILVLNVFRQFELHTKILLGLVLGVAAGLGLGAEIGELKPVGDLFIRLISLIVIPLVFASLVVGTTGLNDTRKLGRIGAKTMGYYMVTTAIAIAIGLLLANGIQPGSGLDEATKQSLLMDYRAEADGKITVASGRPQVSETLLNIVPKNPVRAMAEGRMLQIIFFALLLGVALTLIPKQKAAPVIAVCDGINDAMICIVNLAMKLAPYGVFALIADIVGQYGVGILQTLFKYSLVVVLGLALHALVVLPLALRIMSKMKIAHFFKGIRPAQLIAFSSSSSSATLPITMECVRDNLRVSDKVASFVLPLGATINMDGTALYQGVAAVFIAQVYGLDLTVVDQLTILLTATLASVGAAGAPGIGMITLALVLESLQIPLEGIALILGVDRLLDMCRTAVNVTGDASAAIIVAASEDK